MPVVSLPIPEVDQAIVRPALFDVIFKIESILNISKDTHIFFPSDIKTNPVHKTNIDTENDKRALFTNNKFLYVEVDSDYNESTLSTTAIHQLEHKPFFIDKEIRLSLYPIYLTTDYTINFRYSSPSKNDSIKWRDNIRARISQMRDIILHDLTYSYNIPDSLLQLVSDANTYKNRLNTEPINLLTYIDSHSTSRLTLTSDLANQNKQLSISEKQSRIVGIFEFNSLPEKVERDDGTGNWICTFSYKITFDKPSHIVCRYPVMVYNKLLPSKYLLGSKINVEPTDTNAYASSSITALHSFENNKQMEYDKQIFVPYRIPEFDEFKVEIKPAGCAPAMSILTEIDETDKRSLFNLKDLEEYSIDDDILNFIKVSEYDYITNVYNSILYLCLYENYKFKGNRALTCDRDLNIKAVIDLDPKKIYHVVLSILVDLPYLKQSAVDRLKKNSIAFVKIISCINESLRTYPALSELTRKPYVTPADFNRFFRFIVGYNTKTGSMPNNLFVTPPDMDFMLDLKSGKNRISNPYIEDARHPNDIIPDPYRGVIFENIRSNFVGFKRIQLSSIIVQHYQK